jgi:hypothetical protein
MNTRMFEAFSDREKQVTEYMAGCGMKYGMDCTCGPDCRCKNCPLHEEEQKLRQLGNVGTSLFPPSNGTATPFDFSAGRDVGVGDSNNVDHQKLGSNLFNSYDLSPPTSMSPFGQNASNQFSTNQDPVHVNQQLNTMSMSQYNMSTTQAETVNHTNQQRLLSRVRNASILSYGNRGSLRDGNRNSLRGMSITSETTFGRAMSGLSALSIDWENLDDFDLDVDHSAHINQSSSSPNQSNVAGRRTSASRRSIMSTGSQDGGVGTQVAFKVQ